MLLGSIPYHSACFCYFLPNGEAQLLAGVFSRRHSGFEPSPTFEVYRDAPPTLGLSPFPTAGFIGMRRSQQTGAHPQPQGLSGCGGLSLDSS